MKPCRAPLLIYRHMRQVWRMGIRDTVAAKRLKEATNSNDSAHSYSFPPSATLLTWCWVGRVVAHEEGQPAKGTGGAHAATGTVAHCKGGSRDET